MYTQNCEALEKLKQHRSTIAILEIASLLHDIGKCDNRFPKKQMQDEKDEYDHLSILEYDKKLIEDTKLNDLFFSNNFEEICKERPPNNDIIDKWSLKSASIASFIKKHEKTEEEKKTKKENPETKLIALLRISDKKDSSDDRNMPIAKQAQSTYASTVFGKETKISDLDKLREEFYKELSEAWQEYKNQPNTKKFRKRVILAFKKMDNVIAETRRAANDVSLWHHSYATASIMKALLSGDILTDFSTKLEDLIPTDNHRDVKLKILGIGWNANKFLAESQSLSGLIGRKRLIAKFKRRLKVLLEFDCPVGNLIYEDQDSLCFLVSDKIDETILRCLTEKIIETVNQITEGSIIPIVELSKDEPYPNKIMHRVITNLKKKATIPLQDKIMPQWVHNWNREANSDEVCAQCGKRPKSKNEELCKFCIERIREGASNLLKKAIVSPHVYKETVWIDEIADENGNLALIFGSLPLQEWLDGTRLKTTYIRSIQDIKKQAKELKYTLSDGTKVEDYFDNYTGILTAITKIDANSLTKNKDTAKILYPFLNFRPPREAVSDIYESICKKADSKNPAKILEVLITKSASPSRLRKIGIETQAFFRNLSDKTPEIVHTGTGDYCLRLKFKPKPLSTEDESFLKSANSGMLEVEKFNSEIKLPKSDLFWDGEYAYTTIRLEHYAPSNVTKEKSKKALLNEKQEHIKQVIEKLATSSKTFVTIKEKKNKQAKIALAIESYSFEKYIPVRTILASPNLFVTLVPAELALSIIQKGYVPKYQECFGKVADRLPLNMGILFFKRKFPLYIAMDVMAKLADNLLSLSSEHHIFKVKDRTATALVLEEDNKAKQQLLCTKEEKWLVKYKWEIDDKLGDNSEDLYYPNFIVATDNPDVKKKETYFELGNFGSILNVKDIKKDMSVKIYPSLFDFHFLGNTSERFHLFSDSKKRQHPILGAFGMRPYLLKDIEKMNELWNIISPEKRKLTTSQIKKLEYACITKIEEWFRSGQKLTTNPAIDETYKKFVDSSIANISKRLSPDERNKLTEAVLSGMFFDVVELFLTLKSYNKEAE